MGLPPVVTASSEASASLLAASSAPLLTVSLEASSSLPLSSFAAAASSSCPSFAQAWCRAVSLWDKGTDGRESGGAS